MFTACGKEEEISFKEVHGIIIQNCSPCHRENGPAPFSLLTYKDIKKKASTIQDVLENNIMPPWPADPNYRHFLGERVLDPNSRRKIIKWVEQGAIENVIVRIVKDSIPAKVDEPSLGKQRFYMQEAIDIPGDNQDRFYMVKIPVELEQDTFVRSITFLPGNNKLVHHMNGHWLNYREDVKRDLTEGKSYIDSEKNTDLRLFLEMGIPHDDGTFPEQTPSVVNYLPGMERLEYPEGIGGFKVNKKSSLLIQSIHYGPSPLDDSDLSGIELEYTSKAPTRPLREMQMGSLGVSPIEPEFVLKPGEIISFRTQWKTNKDLSLLTVIPHMHLLGTKYKAFALSPENDTIRLIKINNWDFRWQYFYTFPKIPKNPGWLYYCGRSRI